MAKPVLAFILSFSALLAPIQAAADDASIWVAGPKGCALVANGPDAALGQLGQGDALFDGATMRSLSFACRFDAPFSFVGDDWNIEEREGICNFADGSSERLRFEANYADATHLQINVSAWTMPLDFTRCPHH